MTPQEHIAAQIAELAIEKLEGDDMIAQILQDTITEVMDKAGFDVETDAAMDLAMTALMRIHLCAA